MWTDGNMWVKMLVDNGPSQAVINSFHRGLHIVRGVLPAALLRLAKFCGFVGVNTYCFTEEYCSICGVNLLELRLVVELFADF